MAHVSSRENQAVRGLFPRTRTWLRERTEYFDHINEKIRDGRRDLTSYIRDKNSTAMGCVDGKAAEELSYSRGLNHDHAFPGGFVGLNMEGTIFSSHGLLPSFYGKTDITAPIGLAKNVLRNALYWAPVAVGAIVAHGLTNHGDWQFNLPGIQAGSLHTPDIFLSDQTAKIAALGGGIGLSANGIFNNALTAYIWKRRRQEIDLSAHYDCGYMTGTGIPKQLQWLYIRTSQAKAMAIGALTGTKINFHVANAGTAADHHGHKFFGEVLKDIQSIFDPLVNTGKRTRPRRN